HFARRCPNKKEKSAKMVSQILQISGTTGDDTDIESLYSEQDEQTEDTVFAIHDITSDEEDEHSSVEEGDDPPSYLPIYMMQANSTVEVTIQPPRDLLIGFDLYHKAQKLQVLPTGLKYKRYFQPFSTIPRIFAITDAPAPYAATFKLNEDANPIKASHPGMTPDDLVLAREECNQLLALGLIEPTKSNWACPAFYVNKRTEQIRGKKRLVIDYKALNHFLLDDKFPLPKTKVLFSYLAKAQIFSKFDLKSGFWQLGIDPNDRYKTAFCLPNAQYQWTVMPFGLKVAPSLFQKAMIKIFEPILHTTLIYIDDILYIPKISQPMQNFFSSSMIVQAHGVMLSDKKSFIGQPNIDFLGMKFIDGRYQPGPHITQELLKFPEENLTTKEIQQFLGIVNYLRISSLSALGIQASYLSYSKKSHHPGDKFRLWPCKIEAAWNRQFQQTLDEGKSYSIIILHRPYYEGTGEAKPLPLCRTWKSLEKPLIEQRHEGQELARHLCFVNKIPIPTQGLKLVYTSLAIEPMDEDSDDDPMQEPDSQDPWDYGTEINLESPSFYHGGPSTSA
ncbi:UNVERIFIED_CONTAM: polyprotein, partial [Sesamum calycinum]